MAWTPARRHQLRVAACASLVTLACVLIAASLSTPNWTVALPLLAAFLLRPAPPPAPRPPRPRWRALLEALATMAAAAGLVLLLRHAGPGSPIAIWAVRAIALATLVVSLHALARDAAATFPDAVPTFRDPPAPP